ncbi:unnamed protein product [Echinostoma caproni]|uniref:Ig-like domain-containing protein n=1 Tax=Echinostoma caproni TaxID=27848 RepID=A0A183A291_9TREM|nr:unnamed protein product [Echinostoma caproni]
MAGTYQCSNKLVSRQINIHVYGILNAISSAAQLMHKREIVGHMHFNASVLNTTVHPTVAYQSRVGRCGIKYTSIRWKGGKFETHRSLYELIYSADEVNGYIWSNLTIVHPSANPDLYGKYTCQFNVVSGSIESADVEITIPPLIKRPDSVVGHYSGNELSHTCEVVANPP